MDIVISLTDVEYKGMQYVAVDPEFWASNSVKTRAKIAVDEIVDVVIKYCLDNGIQVPATREDIVNYGFNNNIIMTAKELEENSKKEEQENSE